MNYFPRKLIFALVLTPAIFISASPAAFAQTQTATPPLTGCHIEVGDPHVSTYLLKNRGLIAVKVNAKSECDKPIRDLVLTVEIYKYGRIYPRQVAINEVRIKGLIDPNRIVKNQKTFVKCKNNKWTKYFGVAQAHAIVNGKLMKTLPVISENTNSFQCGN